MLEIVPTYDWIYVWIYAHNVYINDLYNNNRRINDILKFNNDKSETEFGRIYSKSFFLLKFTDPIKTENCNQCKDEYRH